MSDMLNLDTTPYLLNTSSETELLSHIKKLEERVGLLRRQNILTEETIKKYYGENRFLQVAESNAIEGSTLSVGETELAILKGITITGHDPAYIRDAIALDKALQCLVEIARDKARITDIETIREIHNLILGDRLGAGIFRKEAVRISGSPHIPPKTWDEIIKQMEYWQHWSKNSSDLAAPIRAVILHAWFVHVHPYLDGNGRTARAISNLELVRAGYPPIIIKKTMRERYITSLSESDQGGDIGAFFELIVELIEKSLVGLELAAKKNQGYDQKIEKLRIKQEQHWKIWMTSVQLLAQQIEYRMNEAVAKIKGVCRSKTYELELNDYIVLCENQSTNKSWAFIITLSVPGMETVERLAYFGYRSPSVRQNLSDEGGASLYWSIRNSAGYPKWKDDPSRVELTTKNGYGDEWYRKKDDKIDKITSSKLVDEIVKNMLDKLT